MKNKSQLLKTGSSQELAEELSSCRRSWDKWLSGATTPRDRTIEKIAQEVGATAEFVRQTLEVRAKEYQERQGLTARQKEKQPLVYLSHQQLAYRTKIGALTWQRVSKGAVQLNPSNVTKAAIALYGKKDLLRFERELELRKARYKEKRN
jgi:hypothetical protein